MKTKYIYITSIAVFTFCFGNAQTLQDYLNIAKANSSEIQDKTSEYQLANEKVNEVGNLNNTDFSLGYFASTPETRVGAQITKIGVQQELPWFGTLQAEKEVALAVSQTKQFDIELAERDLLFRVKKIYYELYQKHKITYILKENKQILTIYENMALSALENNKATMGDVLKIKIQKNELHSRIFKNLNEVNALSKNFNRLLQRDIDAQINMIDSLSVLDILMKDITIKTHPMLSKIDKLNNVYEAENNLVDNDKLPKLKVGLEYVLVEQRQDLQLSNNGKDIIMPSVALSIPIFTKKYTSRKEQIRIKQEAVISKKISKKKQLEIALEESVLELDNAILNVVAAQKNKVETQLAINVDLKAYETGILNYDKILSLQLQKIRFQIMEVEAIKTAFVSKSKSEYLIN